MESTKKSNSDSSINNTNTNNITLNVTHEKPKRQYTKKKNEPNWYKRTIVGAIITVIVTLIIYYVTGNNQAHNPPGSDDTSNAISGIKQ